MNGYSSSLFGPNDTLSRTQLAQILYNMAGRPGVSGGSGFTDAAGGAWYAAAITWAAQNGIAGGYGDGRLNPGGQAARAQAAQMLKNYLEGK